MTPTIPDEAVEVAARALCTYDGLNPDEEFEGHLRWAEYERGARAALTAAAPLMVAKERPMSEAPEDQEPILIWDAEYEEWLIGERSLNFADEWYTLGGLEIDRPTHWQPLPSAPRDAGPEVGNADPR